MSTSTATAEQRRKVDRMVEDYFRHVGPISANNLGVAEWLFNTVGQGLLEGVEIRYLLDVVFREWGSRVAASGFEDGRAFERKENPSLRAFGEAVALSYRLSAERDRSIARDVFEKLTETGASSAYAFYQALDAIGGRPPKK